jgi:protein TonB
MKIRLACILLVTAVPAALAQNVLFVKLDSGPQLVRGFAFGNPLVVINGKEVSAAGSTLYSLQKAAGYRKGLITISALGVTDTQIDNSAAGTVTLYGTDINAQIQSDVPLKRCFIVLEIPAGLDKGLYVSELADLNPGEDRKMRISAQLQERLLENKYVLHFFSEGTELLNSKMDPAYIAEQAKKTDQLLREAFLKRQPDHPVRMAAGIAPVVPVHPPELKARGIVGSAKVSCTINARGELVSVEIVEASEKPFGEALAAAARQWKFEPAVKDHQFVDSTVVVPYEFKLPAASSGAAKP